MKLRLRFDFENSLPAELEFLKNTNWSSAKVTLEEEKGGITLVTQCGQEEPAVTITIDA